MPSVRESSPVRILLACGAGFAVLAWGLWAVLAVQVPDFDRASHGWVATVFAFVAGGVAFALGRRWQPKGLEREHEFNHSILADAAHSVISTDPEGLIETFSSGAERLLGFRAADVVGKRSCEALHDAEELAERARELSLELGRLVPPGFGVLVAKARTNAQTEERDWSYLRSDGTRVPVRVSITAMRNRRGTITGYLAIASDATRQKLAEERRTELDSRLSNIASQVPGMVFQFKQRADGRQCFPFVSEGIRKIYRLEPDAVVDDSSAIWDRIHPEDLDRVAQSIEQSAASMAKWECDYRTRFADGTIRWVSGTALPERQADGAVLWQGFIADVTERKVAERTHEESRVLLQSVFSSVDLGVFVVDVTSGGEFRFGEVNPAYERLMGISAAEISGRSPRGLVPLIPAETAESLQASFRRGTESIAAIEYEEPFMVSGQVRWWLTRLAPLRDTVGNVVRLVGRSLDITDRKTSELRFQSLTERLQLATEAAEVGIWDHDLQQDRMVWDNRMHAIYGLAQGAFDGTHAAWLATLHPEDLERIKRECQDAKDDRKDLDTSYRIIRPGGEERVLRACAHVQRNAAGDAIRMVAANWDVTAERRTQGEMARARDEAERLNSQLEEALDRATLLAREAAAATVAKSEFLANMSHEIRTPLNAVIGMSGILLSTELSTEQREFAETIRSSGDGLLGLLNDILDYSKIESGRLDLEKRPFDLRDCVESSLDVLAGQAAAKNIDLLYAIDASVPESIIGDDTRLRQVLVNLMANAVKFTSSGEVFLSVRLQRSTGPEEPGRDGMADLALVPPGSQTVALAAGHGLALPGDHPPALASALAVTHALTPSAAIPVETGTVSLLFAVHDSGIGIPADRMHRLFKTFSQVDASTTREFGGTGLGLAICKRIVELMGGRIWAESTRGQGSVFNFEVTVAALAGAKSSASSRSPLLSGRRVLIVDDNATSCRVLCQQCITWGMTPRSVRSGPEALALLARESAFDFALVDVEMPGMNGPEVVAAIRRDRSSRQLPVVMLTRLGQLRVADELGVGGFVSKPVKTAALLDLCVEILHGQKAPSPAVPADGALLGELHPLAILLAEDNPVNQRVASLMLQRLGYRADVAANGREALEAVQRQRYDLVFMDVQMPEMDGLQATREIRIRQPAQGGPRIVAMTANASTTDRDECFASGMDDFLTKPVRTADLRRAIEATQARYVASAA